MKAIIKSIKGKLVIVFLFFCIAPMLVIAYYSYKRAESILLSSVLSNLEVISELKAEQIERFYKRAYLDLYAMQDSYLLKSGVPILLSSPLDGECKKTKERIDTRISNFIKDRDIAGIYIFSMDKEIVAAAVQDESVRLESIDDAVFKEGSRGVYFSDIYADARRSGHFYLSIGAPLYDLSKKQIGVIVVETIADKFFNQLMDKKGLGASGETLIGKKSGDSVLFLSALKYGTKSVHNGKVKLGEPLAVPIQKAINGMSGSGLSVDYRGESVCAAWRPIEAVNWGIVAKMDTSEALKPMSEVSRGIVFTIFILMVFGIAASILLARVLTNPISILRKQIDEIKNGNLDYRAAISMDEEMSALLIGMSDIANNIKERAESNEKMTHMATHDALTGLVNRAEFDVELDYAITDTRRHKGMLGVIFVDLDGFKAVNDGYGHDIGDMLLKEVSVRMCDSVRAHDVVARYGGDEFVILVGDIKNTDTLGRIADTLLKKLKNDFVLDGNTINIGASIGISFYPGCGSCAKELVRAADEAMYAAKTGGKNRFVYYEE